MSVIDLIKHTDHTAFSFEVLPPLKGTGIEKLYETGANMSTRNWATDFMNATESADARELWLLPLHYKTSII